MTLAICMLAVYAWPRALAGARIDPAAAAAAVPSITVSPTVSTPGGIVNGAGFQSNSSFSFQIGAVAANVLGNELVTANLYGSFVALILVPGNFPPGPVTISASDGVTSAGATFTVTAATGAPIATATMP